MWANLLILMASSAVSSSIELNENFGEKRLEIPEKCSFFTDDPGQDFMMLEIEIRENDENGKILKKFEDDFEYEYAFRDAKNGLPGFSKVFDGMCVGEKRTFTVPNNSIYTSRSENKESFTFASKHPNATSFFFRAKLLELAKGAPMRSLFEEEGSIIYTGTKYNSFSF